LVSARNPQMVGRCFRNPKAALKTRRIFANICLCDIRLRYSGRLLDQPLAESQACAINRSEQSNSMMKDEITVVSGLPRSGTSMMMNILTAGGIQALTDGERLPDESNPRGYFELEKVKYLGRDRSFLSDAVGKVVKVVSPLLKHLSSEYHYRVIFM